MRILLFLTLLIFFNYALAGSLFVELFDVRKKQKHSLFINLDSFKIIEGMKSGESIPDARSGEYSVIKEVLTFKSNKLIDADELLYEARIGERDIVVIRDEYNSFSNPLKWLSAFAGHPVQTSKIYILDIKSGKLRNKLRLQEQDSSYRWNVEVKHAN